MKWVAKRCLNGGVTYVAKIVSFEDSKRFVNVGTYAFFFVNRAQFEIQFKLFIN